MFTQFVIEYWYLFLILAVLIALIFLDPSLRGGGARKLSTLEVPNVINKHGGVMIDVRPADTYAAGHIAKSISIPIAELDEKLRKIEKYKEKPVVLVCDTGAISASAAKHLKKAEFTTLYQLEGGLHSWRKDNMPLTKAKEPTRKKGE